MSKSRNGVSLVVAMLCCVGMPALATPEQIAKGVWLEDFEDGSLDGWESRSVRPMDVQRTEDGSYLGLRGSLWRKDKPFENGVIEMRMCGLAGGEAKASGEIRFRGGCRARFVQRGRVMLETTGKRRKQVREMKRSRDLQAWATLKVVCAGDVVTAYVDGEFACQLTGAPVTADKVGIASGQRVHVDYVKITDHVKPEDYLVIEPTSDDDCLVFAPGKPIPLRMKVKNRHSSAQKVPIGIKVRRWAPPNLAEPAPVTVSVPAGGEVEQVFPIGALEEGYYQVVVEPTGMSFPIAVQEKLDPATAKVPKAWPGRKGGPLKFMVYWYFNHGSLPELWANTYCHAAARDLQKHGFNAIVTMGAFKREHMDILAAYGIYSHTRNGGHMDHRFVAGTLVGDEPKDKDIPSYRKKYEKIRGTCRDDQTIVTGTIGGSGVERLVPHYDEFVPLGHARLIRWYGVKKEQYGILNAYGKRPSLVQMMRDVRALSRKDGYPNWVVLPSLGSRGPESYYGLPSPAQIRSMMHIVAAHSAKGFVFWTYQDHTFYSKGKVAPETLQPSDGRWAEAGRMAHLLQPHAALLESLRETDLGVFCGHPAVEAVRSVSEQDGHPYVYLVNRHPLESAEFKLHGIRPGAEVRDVYSGKSFQAGPGTAKLLDGSSKEMGAVALSLDAASGMLLRCAKGSVALKPVPGADWEAAGNAAIERALSARADRLANAKKAKGSALHSSAHMVKVLTLDDKEKGVLYFLLVNRHPLEKADFTVFGFEPDQVAKNADTGKDVKIVPETRTGLNGTKFDTRSAQLSIAPGGSLLLQVDKKMVTCKAVRFPTWVEQVEENVQYLYETKPRSGIAPGWSKRGKSIEEQGGTVRLFSAGNDRGVAYENCLFAHAEHRVSYGIPEGCTHFAAAAGFGSKTKEGDAVFQVWVDGEKKYDSGVVRSGDPVQRVVVDVEGGDELTLVTLSADHCIKQDYVFWGEAQLVGRDE